jgi:NhaA family Na+:H+ antiporter
LCREAWSAISSVDPEERPAVRVLRRLASLVHPKGPVVGRVTRPFARFLELEAASGIMLLGATVIAVAWANSPWSSSYGHLLHLTALPLPGVELDVHGAVDDALMALFFFVVGLEIRREVVAGELRDRRTAALPVVAAIGGMVVPALVYVAVNAGHPGSSGWGIPMATDIAFAVGVASLLGRRVPTSLTVFLLTAAVVDDLGAIAVIAVFYTDSVRPVWLAGAAASLVGLWLIGRRGWWSPAVFAVVGAFVWYATLRSGLHATLAGVALAMVVPRAGAEPVADRVEERWHPWTSYVVIPVFALANAGVALGGDAVSDALSSRVTWGVIAGLVVGKVVGVAGAGSLAIRLGVGRRPAGTNGLHLLGVGIVAGLGFTMSIFVTLLAFDSPQLVDESKIGVFGASIVAAALGLTTLWFAAQRATPRSPELGPASASST